MTKDEILVSPEALQAFIVALLLTTGMSQEDAGFFAGALVQTNLWGIDSHGVLRAPVYLKRLHSRAMNPTPNIKIVRESGALAVVDGDDGAGFVVGRAAMDKAVALAEQHSVGVVGAIRSNHFGAAGLYARMATERGMIGIVMTSVKPNIVAPGGSRPITGNNPIAVGIPTFGDFPFVLDISLSNAAGGKLLLASKKGERIPLDWATDKNGRPTNDPDEAFAGFLLPLGGHKGLGLSYVVDILSGLITGGVYQHALKSMYSHPADPSLTGHFMMVINPLALLSREALQEQMEDFCQTIKTSPTWDEKQEMMLPGEIEHRTAVARQKQGIPLPVALYAELKALGAEHGVLMPSAA